MNAIQFGRWLGDRRHACGWTSQRALAAAAQRNPYTAGLRISEAFLARLEAGLLSHPFRGAVRERVLALAWLVCKSPRHVRGYLTAAGLMDLTGDELSHVETLRRALSEPHRPPPIRLPRRVPRLVAREAEVTELVDLLVHLEGGCVAITGLPGIGKSALAAEVLHRLSDCGRDHDRFADGTVTFDCAGRIGDLGLRSLLEDVAMLYGATVAPVGERTPRGDRAAQPGATGGACETARAIDLARSALRGRRTLILLDGVDPRFPLNLALEALLAADPVAPESRWPAVVRGGRVVLVTSRYVPRGSQLAGHVSLAPLDPDAAIELSEHTAGRRLAGREREAVARLCGAAGGVPLAIEEVATALAASHMPLSPRVDASLAVRLLERQRGSDGMRERLASAVGVLDDAARRALLHLALGAARRDEAHRPWRAGDEDQPSTSMVVGDTARHVRVSGSTQCLPDAGSPVMAAIAQLVRHSLVQPRTGRNGAGGSFEARWDVELNPLVRALVLEGDMDELLLPGESAATPPESDTVRFLRRGDPRGQAAGGQSVAARQRAGGQ